MRVLILSRDLSWASLCHCLAREGHEVRVFLSHHQHADALDGLFEQAASLEAGVSWVGKDGLVVADHVGCGSLQDDLRAQGYSVVGGSAGGDKLEEDRPHCQRVLAEYGIPAIPTAHFSNAAHAIAHVRAHGGHWVIKQNGHAESTFCYVGQLPDGTDVIDVLAHYARNYGDAGGFVLQQRVFGVEIGVAQYFNGQRWVGPVEINVEHKDLCAGDMGPKTSEMGTLMWYEASEQQRLFQETLAKLEPYLRQVDFRGNIDINCIVNENGVFPLEVTARFGYPAFQLQTEIHVSPWGEFLKAVADGQDYALDWRRGYGLVALVAAPPFPYYSGGGRYPPVTARPPAPFPSTPD